MILSAMLLAKMLKKKIKTAKEMFQIKIKHIEMLNPLSSVVYHNVRSYGFMVCFWL